MFAPYVSHKIPTRPRPEDPDDVRLGAFVRRVESSHLDALSQIKENHFVILGYPDDRGVDRNGGRLGAADGPDAIRQFLYNMTPDPLKPRDLVIWDLGNLKSWSLSLVEAHEEARKAVQELRKTKARLITLGGGHDWAYPDFADFPDRLVNLDAHLDMRPLSREAELASHSGTPFRKILSTKNDASFLSVIGLQRHCNARAHVEWAKGLRADLLFLEDMPSTLEEQWVLLRNRLSLESSQTPFAISVDLDAFPQSFAPGVSAPQSFGLDPRLALRLIHTLGPRLKQLGVYELNPLFDRDGETARLSAKIVYEFLNSAI